MLTRKPQESTAASAKERSATSTKPAPAPVQLDDLISYFEGQYVPLRDAKVSIMTHAFMYGTAVFEGIRGYWNEEQETLYALKVPEHMDRIRRNAQMLLMEDLPSVDELVRIVVETVRRNGFRQDVYIRPSFYKSDRAVGVRLHHLAHQLYVFTLPFGNYVDIDSGTRLMTSSWRRNADDAIPARGKIVGGYVNMAFQKSEAELNGFDEALVLTPDGHASEASAANLFMIRDGVLITPPVSDDILEGVTRKAIMELAAVLNVPTEIRSMDRSEVYIADEVFLCGTGVQLSPVIEVDHRAVGSGSVGPLTRQIQDAYFNAVRGRDPRFAHWLTPIPSD
jgi:branched-chain amino acid aminotransferase